mgnify:CR=1 FL=1
MPSRVTYVHVVISPTRILSVKLLAPAHRIPEAIVGFAAIGTIRGFGEAVTELRAVIAPAGEVTDKNTLTVKGLAVVPGADSVNVIVFPLFVDVTPPEVPVDELKKKSVARARVAAPAASRTVIVQVTVELAETVALPVGPIQSKVDATAGMPITVNVTVPEVPDVNAVAGEIRP